MRQQLLKFISFFCKKEQEQDLIWFDSLLKPIIIHTRLQYAKS